MPLVQLKNLTFGYGSVSLLEDVTLQIEPGERIGLLGRNGAGKSTLLKLIAGEIRPDHGDVTPGNGVKIARLAQDVPAGTDLTIFDEIALGLGEHGQQVARIHSLSSLPERTAEQAAELDACYASVDFESAWQLHRQVEEIADRMSLDTSAMFATLSSGMKRRVLLAQALVVGPDLLLLDEPTNHLDIDAIRWIEDFLTQTNVTLVFITHDRAFLQRLANRIVEVDRGRLYDWTCDYATFLVRKEQTLAAESRQDALFDKRLAEEEVWIRTGIKARRTRNEGRVRALEDMRRERAQRRSRVGNVSLLTQEAERSGNLVASLQDVTHAYDERTILSGVTTTIFRGDKVGLLGPNGVGKTTLLRILLGQLTPQQGTVRLGTNLQIAYFDQLRAQLDENKTPAEIIGEGNDTVTINGRARHVVGYLSDFLFTGERARTLIKYLSGGERNRLLLAKLLARPANLLVLDEPTNDLDQETLELLEEMLLDFKGTLLVVSHDRTFLDNIVTSTLAFEPGGNVREFVGGYSDWLRQSTANLQAFVDGKSRAEAKSAKRTTETTRKLSYKEQRELETLPKRIDSLEQEQAELHEQLGNPQLYQKGGTAAVTIDQRLKEIGEELAQAYQRWSELEP